MRKILLDLDSITHEVIEEVKAKTPEENSITKMFDYLNQFEIKSGYGFGVHNTRVSKNNIDSILNNGLQIVADSTVLSTVSSFGTRHDLKDEVLQKNIIDYGWLTTAGECNKVMFMVPNVIKKSNGDKLYLGFPPYDTTCAGNDRRVTCVLDAVCRGRDGIDGKGNIPKEFIVGYFTQKGNGVNFVPNEKFYELLSQEEKDKLFDYCDSMIEDKFREVSDAVINKDIKKLEELSGLETIKINKEIKEKTKRNVLDRGMNQTVAESVARSAVQSDQEDFATNALVYLEAQTRRHELLKQDKENFNNRKTFISALISRKNELEA